MQHEERCCIRYFIHGRPWRECLFLPARHSRQDLTVVSSSSEPAGARHHLLAIRLSELASDVVASSPPKLNARPPVCAAACYKLARVTQRAARAWMAWRVKDFDEVNVLDEMAQSKWEIYSIDFSVAAASQTFESLKVRLILSLNWIYNTNFKAPSGVALSHANKHCFASDGSV